MKPERKKNHDDFVDLIITGAHPTEFSPAEDSLKSPCPMHFRLGSLKAGRGQY